MSLAPLRLRAVDVCALVCCTRVHRAARVHRVLPHATQVNPGVEEDRLHGRVGLWGDGSPAWKPTPLVFKLTAEQKRAAHAGYCFNTRVSESLSLDREVPDFSSPGCRLQRKFFDAFTAPHPTPLLQQQQREQQQAQQQQQPQRQEEKEAQQLQEARQQPEPQQQRQEHHQPLQQQQEQDRGVTFAAEAENVVPFRQDGYLPNTSVVIIFYNENMSVLLRTAHSVLNRTPASLLKEIILVDDYSDTTTHPWLGQQLEDYVAGTLPKTRLLRLLQRRGLMGARMAGASVARGDTITFLDSHVECLPFWLQPLLFHVRQNWQNIALPEISSIHHDTLQIRQGGLSTLGFTWGLAHHHLSDRRQHRRLAGKRRETEAAEVKGHERGEQTQETANEEEGGGGEEEAPDPDAPIASPIMAGGIFTISRRWWRLLEGYDREMELYGGEEFELSFKVWMCGGQLHVIPCSKVAHIFRSSEFWQGQVYPVPGEKIAKNKLRVAAVWMEGQYQQLVRLVQPPIAAAAVGDVSEQLLLKKELGCQSFSWYLREVYPELLPPPFFVDDATLSGAVKNRKFECCLDTLSSRGDIIGAYPCHYQHGTQAFLYSRVGYQLVVAEHNFEECVWGDVASRRLPERPCSRGTSSSSRRKGNSSNSKTNASSHTGGDGSDSSSSNDTSSISDKNNSDRADDARGASGESSENVGRDESSSADKKEGRGSSSSSGAQLLWGLQRYLPRFLTAGDKEDNLSEFWYYSEASQQLQLMRSNGERALHVPQLCMEATDEATEKSPFNLLLRPCDARSLAQKFVFIP